MMDKYDHAIEYLTAHPEEIYDAWGAPSEQAGGCLFQFLGPDSVILLEGFGCPVLVKSGMYLAWNDALTEAVLQEPDIPEDVDKIRVEHLPAFARVQRLADDILGRA